MKKTLLVSKEIIINNRAKNVFPLLCPVKEYDWIPTWKCELIHSNSGFNEKGCVFTTENAYGSNSMVWTTQEFDLSTYTVRFTNFASSGFVVQMRINLFELEEGKTCKAVFNYEFIPVSDAGTIAVDSINPKDVETTVNNLGLLLNKYFNGQE
jgi:hypothetical protein